MELNSKISNKNLLRTTFVEVFTQKLENNVFTRNLLETRWIENHQFKVHVKKSDIIQSIREELRGWTLLMAGDGVE